MFYLNRDTDLTIPLLNKMINRFVVEVQPKLEKNKKYYDGIQAILNKSYSDTSKPCNRTVINYCKDILQLQVIFPIAATMILKKL